MARTSATTKSVQANGLTFHIGVAGSGPKVLFLTGSNADLRRINTPLNSPLVDQFTVLTFDQRGMGQTEKPDCVYSMKNYADDAVAILNVMEWDRVRLVGYSFGGMVAQEIAIGYPERVERLALLATTAGGAGGSSYPIHTFTDLEPIEHARRSLEVSDLSFTPKWQQNNPVEAEQRIANRLRAISLFGDEPGHAIGASRQLAARAQHDTFERLPFITQRTLVLAGNRDGQAPVNAQKALAKRIPNSSFEIIEGSHGMLWESDLAFKAIIEFMQ